MNPASRFFSFVLLPIFSFAIGFHVAVKNIDPQENITSKNIDPKKTKEIAVIFKNLLEKEVDLYLVEEILKKVEEKFFNPKIISSNELSFGLAKGLVYALKDPYSSYMTPDESNSFQESLDGSLEGIGAELTMRNGNITVVSPLKNSPSMKAGLLPQDIIVKIDKEDVTALNLEQVVKKIRGKPNTIVVLTIARKNLDELIDIEIVRQRITIESVNLEIKDKIAILEVSQFGTNTKEEFEKHLMEALMENPIGIILDLRFNSGGFLEKARDLVSCFIEEGKVTIIKSRPPNIENVFVTGEKKTDLPLVILQNKGSASASEIVAGALQDFERAKIVGTRSFGKGTVQELIPLKHGGNLRLTVSQWLTPKGHEVNEKGIKPDYFIENTIEDFENGRDPQMEMAMKILQGEEIEIKMEIEND